jgi:hypothetical protein
VSHGSTRVPGAGAIAAVGGGLLLFLGGATVVLGVGLRGGGDEPATGGPSRSAPATSTIVTTTTAAPAKPPTTVAPAPVDLAVRDVALHLSAADEFTPPSSIVDRLPDRTVLRVSATGFEPWSTGVIEQCTTTGCGNAFPVSFDGNGNERLQYLAADDFAVAGALASCGPDDPPCVVRVSSADAAVYVSTVFGGAAPAPRMVAIDTPAGGVADGDTVTVTASGFPAGERVQAMLCAAPATFGTARCGAPGPVAAFAIGDDGRGSTSLVVRRGRVGTDGAACGRDAPCGVAVTSAATSVPGPVVPITFAAGPSAAYDAGRVLVGLLIAALLLGLATYLVRTTDWRKPTEADTPALDRAVL